MYRALAWLITRSDAFSMRLVVHVARQWFHCRRATIMVDPDGEAYLRKAD